ncbi:MAG TPA: sigma-70 family RNA polymerase sigma factor [Gemmatimonadales bacterium]|nr:sigma-70 family RNA polymerase sigma factor [Gemmatimonadales bacterium]
MNFPPAISQEATLALIAQMRIATSPEERERFERLIVEGNLRFCAYHARRYQQVGLDLEDLVAVAAAALVEAIRKFDPAKSTHFSAYARRCIRRDLIVLVRRQASPIRLPREARKAEAENGRATVTSPEAVSMDHKRAAATKDTGPDPQEWSKRGRPAAGFELETENPEDGLLAGIDAERLAKLVDGLPEREATVIRMRFGLAGMAPHELAEIGVVIGVSKQRVALILDQALATLKQAFAPTKAAA